MIPIDEILEALEVAHADPGIGYLERLFSVFNERVPFETASKILRAADVADPAKKPRRPEVFWSDHLETGAGGTCFARVAAFDALLAPLGFKSRVMLGRVESDFDHAALLVTLEGEEWICDVGFPLPALLRCAEGETDTAGGALRVSRCSRGWRVKFLGGVPEGPRALELFSAAVTPEDFSRRWEETYNPASKFLRAVSLRREKAGRTVSFAAGEIRVDDLHSRTRIPLPAPRAPVLEEQFGVDRKLLESALAVVGDREPAIASPEVSVYLDFEGLPEAAFAAIASPGGYRALMEGVAQVTDEQPVGVAWRVRLGRPVADAEEPQPAGFVEEEITPDSEKLALRVRRGSQESFYQVQSRDGETFLVRRLALAGPRLDLLRNDSLRGRLAGALAVDLLAWARLLQRTLANR